MAQTPLHDAIDNDKSAAEEALERADAKELHVLFSRSQERFAQMETALANIVAHYVGGKEQPRYIPGNDNAIAAMERVAMDALALAKFVVEQSQKVKP